MKAALREAGDLRSQMDASNTPCLFQNLSSLPKGSETNHIFHLAAFQPRGCIFNHSLYSAVNLRLLLTVMKEDTTSAKDRPILPRGKIALRHIVNAGYFDQRIKTYTEFKNISLSFNLHTTQNNGLGLT